MKTLKRVFAVIIAVILVAMMTVAVSAASNTITWELEKPGYTYTVYQVAKYNSTTGQYTATLSSLDSYVKAAGTDTSALAAACKTATFTDAQKVNEFTTSTTVTSGSITVDNGIYFVKCTQKGPNCKAITTEPVVVFPNANNTTTTDLNLASKVNEGEPTVDKTFSDGTTATKTFGTGEDITYTLSADIPGSTTSKLTSYVITDKMGAGLDTTSVTIKSVQLVNGTTKTDLAYSISTDSTVINRDQTATIDGKAGTTGNTFGVVIDSAELAKDDFYTEGNKVVVTYTTKLTADAAVGTLIPNTDDLIYGNGSGYNVVPGDTVNVKTYTVVAYKTDAATGNKLADATFELYKADDKTTPLATSVASSETGKYTFDIRLAAGTYYVKETVAPTGYNLNSSFVEVKVGDSTTTGIGEVTIEDTQAKLPTTGGTGTVIFTIIGGSLVLLAAAMFIVVMKKRSSAK